MRALPQLQPLRLLFDLLFEFKVVQLAARAMKTILCVMHTEMIRHMLSI